MQEVNEKTRLLPAGLIQKQNNYHLINRLDENFNELPVKLVKSGSKWPQYLAALAATGGALSAGTALSWLSSAGPILTNSTDPSYNFTVTEENISWMSSAMNCGAALICIPAGLLTNILGRKFTMLLMNIPFIFGWICITFAPNLEAIIFGRVLLGFAIGTFCVTTTLYISEIAQKDIRGKLASFFQLMMSIGTLFIYTGGTNFNVFWLSFVCGIVPLIFGVIFFYMPESPTYLVMNNRSQDAAKALEWLNGNNYDCSKEISELQFEHEERKVQNLSILRAFSKRATIRALTISLGLTLFQQFCGISVVIYYTNHIFSAANIELEPEVQIMIVVMQVLATLVSALFVDHWGRRKLLLVSGAVMTVCSIAFSSYFHILEIDKDSVTCLRWLPMAAFIAFIFSYSFGFGSVPWVLMGELFSSDVSALSSSLSTTLYYLFSFLVTKTFIIYEGLLSKSQTFWIFSGFNLIATCFVIFFVIETKGKTLSEIQKKLSSKKGYKTLTYQIS